MADFQDRVENSLAKMHEKIDHISDKVNNLHVETAKNTVILDEHQRRSIANEEKVDLLEKKIDIQKEIIKKEFSNDLLEKAKFSLIILLLTISIVVGGKSLGIVEFISGLFG